MNSALFRLTLAGLLAIATAFPTVADEGDDASADVVTHEGPEHLTFDQIFDTPPAGSQVAQMAFSPDGETLTYVLADLEAQVEEGEDPPVVLWAMATSDGTARPLLAARELPSGGDDPGEIDAYQWSDDGTSLLVESGGDLFLLDSASGDLSRLTESEADEEDARLSPDGRDVAFVRGQDLWAIRVANGKERRLTTGGEENVTLNGKADWVYWEEIWGRDATAFWWSPDSRHLAFLHFDETAVETYPLVNFLTTYPEVTEQRYPKAGSSNPAVRIGIVGRAGGDPTWLDTGDGDQYLARVHWLAGGEKIAVERLNRDQTTLDLLLCDPADGSCETLLSETSETWVNLGDDTHFLEDGRFLWASERSGWRRIYLYAADGSLITVLADGLYNVTSVDAVVESTNTVFLSGYAVGLGAAHRAGHKAPLGPGRGVPVTVERGWHALLVASDGQHWVETASSANVPTIRLLTRQDGKRIAELPSGVEPPFEASTLPQWELITVWGFDGTRLPAQLLKPVGFDPQKSYPTLMYHYGGPASQVVAERWGSRARALWHKMMAQRGYVVLKVDNAGSNFFGKRGADRMHRRFGPLELEAQLAAVEFLKQQPWVDASRIGLWGWSGGGSNTLYSVLNRPGVWKAAVAGAPVTDWRFYDTIWTERYLDHPEDNPDGYEKSSAVTYADRLTDALLIVHGTADDNVHPQNTLAISNAFIEAGVPFEQAIYPRQKHGFRAPASRHFFERMTEFFDRHLKGEGGE